MNDLQVKIDVKIENKEEILKAINLIENLKETLEKINFNLEVK